MALVHIFSQLVLMVILMNIENGLCLPGIRKSTQNLKNSSVPIISCNKGIALMILLFIYLSFT